MGWRVALCMLAAVQLSSQYLLPGDVIPSHYDVRLAYDVDPKTNFSFFGVVDIQLIAKKSTPKIVLHAQEFLVDDEKVSIVGLKDTPKVTDVKLNDTYNFLTITLDRDLEEDENYTLTIPFYGNLVKGLDGAYISSYTNLKSKRTEYLVSTQFEATSARKGFPCFDEPIYKATFAINIAHHKDYSAVSNMPLDTSSSNNAMEAYWPWEKIGQIFK
ncbi:thyrotropin-releasing hormone-degrading ectoenzyme-like [Vanessa cardui]|uniref:thyrotropin-releasing hormone-degrading ectoenzyme-like n=1 Tax=Vanessa cardui TaxID=171605 RepID=UPI001F1409A3|nr:thyrotropin-releasing hormone-degrading ectoenzyme-like [Vanessa cardui]XP_046972973.1 thyrotropin-releasing hormone-degrading ectoenzyme-like [Vanessa cardui]XP_046972974.1 thyrotropin-releasing hormone-degrading ectoenzyme-like [Vanessa cardui]